MLHHGELLDEFVRLVEEIGRVFARGIGGDAAQVHRRRGDALAPDEEFKKMMKEQVGEDQIKAILQRRKAVEDLKSNVVFVEAKEEKEEEEK